jgi:hypothetical protein
MKSAASLINNRKSFYSNLLLCLDIEMNYNASLEVQGMMR